MPVSAVTFYAGAMYPDVAVRSDLADAHERVWASVSEPGDWWTGAERREAAGVVLAAFHDLAPTPPWVPVADRFAPVALSGVVVNALYRMTAHASTLTVGWYETLIASGVPEPAYVELCGIVSSVSAVTSFARSVGSVLPSFPVAVLGAAARPSLDLDRSPRNWVPVVAPGGVQAPVVEALSASPLHMSLLWDHLAPTQYMADREMDDLAWSRGTVSRPQTELLAGRISALRQCFF
jgi:hypothetical protein